MSERTTAVVYDKDGKRHELPRANATDCVQHLGWSWKPSAVEQEETDNG